MSLNNVNLFLVKQEDALKDMATYLSLTESNKKEIGLQSNKNYIYLQTIIKNYYN